MTEAEIIILVLQNLPLIKALAIDIEEDAAAVFSSIFTGISAAEQAKINLLDAVNAARAKQMLQSLPAAQ